MENTVIQAVNANVKLLKKKFKVSSRLNKNILKLSCATEGRATVLYEGLISPYVDVESFRNKFEYEIKIDKLITISQSTELFLVEIHILK